jgi:hypothetical protein
MASIYDALTAFLDEEKARVSARTFENYEAIILYFRKMLVREGFPSVEDERIQQLYKKVIADADGQNIDALLQAIDVDVITGDIGMFLDWYMPRKVIDTAAIERAAVPTMRKFAKFLVERKYIDAETAVRVREDIEEAVRGSGSDDIDDIL